MELLNKLQEEINRLKEIEKKYNDLVKEVGSVVGTTVYDLKNKNISLESKNKDLDTQLNMIKRMFNYYGREELRMNQIKYSTSLVKIVKIPNPDNEPLISFINSLFFFDKHTNKDKVASYNPLEFGWLVAMDTFHKQDLPMIKMIFELFGKNFPSLEVKHPRDYSTEEIVSLINNYEPRLVDPTREMYDYGLLLNDHLHDNIFDNDISVIPTAALLVNDNIDNKQVKSTIIERLIWCAENHRGLDSLLRLINIQELTKDEINRLMKVFSDNETDLTNTPFIGMLTEMEYGKMFMERISSWNESSMYHYSNFNIEIQKEWALNSNNYTNIFNLDISDDEKRELSKQMTNNRLKKLNEHKVK